MTVMGGYVVFLISFAVLPSNTLVAKQSPF